MFKAVASKVILITTHCERVAGQRIHAALRHREGVVLEVDLAGLVVLLVDREVDDPSESEAVCLGQAQLGTDHVARLARHALEARGLAAEEEGGVTDVEPKLLADRLGALRADVLGERAGGLDALALVAPEDIAHAGQTLFLRECVHPVAEFA